MVKRCTDIEDEIEVANENVPRIDFARAVIDAWGTWQHQNPLGAGGLPAIGEPGCAGIAYGIPDILGRDRDTYSGQRVCVRQAETSMICRNDGSASSRPLNPQARERERYL